MNVSVPHLDPAQHVLNCKHLFKHFCRIKMNSNTFQCFVDFLTFMTYIQEKVIKEK